jgi:hypothetical protein
MTLGQLASPQTLGVLVGLSVLLFAAREVGAALRRRAIRGDPRGDESEDDGFVLSGALGLLALLVAFTFSMGLNHYEERRDLVLAEANALGAAWDRTDLLTDPAPVRAALLSYVRQRVALGPDADAIAPAERAGLDAARRALWARAVEAVAPERTTPLAPFVLTPVDEAFDLASAREAAHEARIPVTVLGALILYAFVSAGVLGYAAPSPRVRVVSDVMLGLLTLAIALTLDLDQPGVGTIFVSERPMAEALAAMEAAANAPPG